MTGGQQINTLRWHHYILLIIGILLIFASCTVPRRYQKDTPFIFKTDIDVESSLPPGARMDLNQALQNQLDDSLKVRTVLAVRAIPPFFYYRLSRPPVFDTLYVGRSKQFMNALLNSRGYFNAIIRDTFTVDTIRDQQRVQVNFRVETGKVLRLDSIGIALTTPELQQLALDARQQSLLKKNDPYSLQTISAELDRMLGIFRNHGYYKISKEDLIAEHDTVAFALIDPTLDPFEQVRLIDSLQEKAQNPTINIIFKQRLPKDSAALQKYYFGNITVYPDLPYFSDTAGLVQRRDTLKGYTFITNSNKFKLPFLARNIFIQPGGEYRIGDYFKTVNTFNNLGAWQQFDIDLTERQDSVNLLDAALRLYPSRKYSLNLDFEASRNASDVFTTGFGYLFGIGFNVGVNNRNAFRESIQTTTNLRFGVELGTNLIQTVQTSLTHSIYIPRFILPFGLATPQNVLLPKTVIGLNGAYTERRKLLNARTLNGSWGYEWSKRKEGSSRTHAWQFIPLNVEYTVLDETDSLRKIIEEYPTVRYAYNDGLIISQILTYSTMQARGKHRSIYRVRFEQSGALSGMIRPLARGALNRFVKTDLEYKYYIENKASTWAFRAFGGYGKTYGTLGNEAKNTLPFFKSYFGGGPYSMRAWRVRQLGLGSSIYHDTANRRISLDRFGDIQLEGNIEFRFDIGRIFGVKVESALFTDIGNVWRRNTGNDPNLENTDFKFSRLYRDLAVAGGTSLRFDFDFFLIRFDYAYKLKDPFHSGTHAGWLHNLHLKDGQFQLGIGYSF